MIPGVDLLTPLFVGQIGLVVGSLLVIVLVLVIGRLVFSLAWRIVVIGAILFGLFWLLGLVRSGPPVVG
ncbi:MAG: hypothetical protein ACOCUO_02465 [archaeon]